MPFSEVIVLVAPTSIWTASLEQNLHNRLTAIQFMENAARCVFRLASRTSGARIMIQSVTKRCSRCLQKKALTHFRLCKKGATTRRSECNDCHREAEVSRQRLIRKNQQALTVQKATTQICQTPPSDPTRIARIAESLIEESGGWNKFVGVWRQTLETARRQKRHGRVYRMLHSLQKLQLAGEALQIEALKHEPDDVQFERLIRQCPEGAAYILDSMGWHTAPPESAERSHEERACG